MFECSWGKWRNSEQKKCRNTFFNVMSWMELTSVCDTPQECHSTCGQIGHTPSIEDAEQWYYGQALQWPCEEMTLLQKSWWNMVWLLEDEGFVMIVILWAVAENMFKLSRSGQWAFWCLVAQRLCSSFLGVGSGRFWCLVACGVWQFSVRR